MKTKILTLGLICLLILGSILSAKEKRQTNFWQNFFTEPFETVYIIMKDGTAFKHTNQEERFIRLSAGILKETLKKKSYKIKDIAIIIHNHRIEQKFSPTDWKFYKDLKKRGFDGLFLIYCHRTNKTYILEEKKESNMKYRRQKKERPHLFWFSTISPFADNIYREFWHSLPVVAF